MPGRMDQARPTAVRFEGFEGGEWGRVGATDAGRREKQLFSARNVVRTDDALLSPRAGLHDQTPTGLPAGTVWGFGYAPVPGRSGFLIVGADLYRFDIDAEVDAAVLVGALAAVPTRPVRHIVQGTDVYLTSWGDQSYRYDPVAGLLVPLAGSPGGVDLVQYGHRLVVAGDPVIGNRLHYSEPGDPDGWDLGADLPAGYIDIGDPWNIAAVEVFRDGLIIAKQTGLYMLTGTPGSSVAVRHLRALPGAEGPLTWAVDEDSRLWFIGRRHPSVFTGATVEHVDHLRVSDTWIALGRAGDTPPAFSVVPLEDGDVAFVTTNGMRVALHRGGTWTLHEFDVDISGHATRGALGTVHFAAPGPKVYAWRWDLDHPGIDSQPLERAGDAGDVPPFAYVELPEWVAPDGREAHVRQVIVDVRTWDTGASVDNQLTCEVVATRLYAGGGERAGLGQTWTEEGADTLPTGADRRLTFMVGDQGKGGGFRVNFTGLRGVAIRSVEVSLDIEERRG